MHRILVTGALGQIGAELVPALRDRYGAEAVVASDIRMPSAGDGTSVGPFEYVDCTHIRQIESAVRRYDIDTIFHLAALLSAVAESKPRTAWDINMGGVYRVLEVARSHGCAVFHPSSIGAFGPGTPRVDTPQDTVQRPTTMYGITKVAGELLCDYYATRFGTDTRGLRLPGLVSYVAPPGGGTTDYAVDIYHQALRHGHYTCYLRPDTALDLMYMPDAIRAMIELMEADRSRLVHHNAFNVTAMSATPAQLAGSIRAHIPGFVVDYDVDPVRQSIADSWPDSLDDSAARAEWGWAPRYDLEAMTADMLTHLRTRAATAG
ncbi:MAG TPA: L-threonine 3-dehydrogenase [Acidimicrobiales bacterium]